MSQDRRDYFKAPLSVAELVREIEAGWTPRYLCFWGHRAKSGQTAGKHVLSQWWERDFEIGGIRYPSAEHYMMAEKARMFGDGETSSLILEASSPGRQGIGRRVRGFADAEWAAGRFDIVVRGNLAKFGQNAELRTYLVNTGGQVLVEASPVDRIWGAGLAADDPRVQTPEQWPGMNLLGFALMKVRTMLCAEGGAH